jgi:hypothetical protein
VTSSPDRRTRRCLGRPRRTFDARASRVETSQTDWKGRVPSDLVAVEILSGGPPGHRVVGLAESEGSGTLARIRVAGRAAVGRRPKRPRGRGEAPYRAREGASHPWRPLAHRSGARSDRVPRREPPVRCPRPRVRDRSSHDRCAPRRVRDPRPRSPTRTGDASSSRRRRRAPSSPSGASVGEIDLLIHRVGRDGPDGAAPDRTEVEEQDRQS